MSLKNELNRREFIKAATAAGCLLPISRISGLAWGEPVSSPQTLKEYPGNKQTKAFNSNIKAPLLVTIFLKGGADGLNLVCPSNDLDLIEARPADLRVLDSGSKAGFLLDQSLEPRLGFYLHHEAPALDELYKAKRLSVIHAVGITDATRSHEQAQTIIESGAASVKHENRALRIPGWMSRSLLQNSPGQPILSSHISAYSASTITPYSLEGLNSALISPDLNNGLNTPWGKITEQFLRNLSRPPLVASSDGLYSKSLSPIWMATSNALQMQENVNRSIARDANGKALPYQASGTANYAGSGELARSLSSIARLAKMEVGLQVANVNFGGWDTHESQSGPFGNAVRQLSKGIGAFYEDMLASNQQVTILVMTEFGRRVRVNKSNGTDHGHGACWFALGDQVQGGSLLGKWPGLKSSQMDQGLDLAVTTDYRQVLYEAMLTSRLNLNEALMGWSASPSTQALNLFI